MINHDVQNLRLDHSIKAIEYQTHIFMAFPAIFLYKLTEERHCYGQLILQLLFMFRKKFGCTLCDFVDYRF
jgi:hypothetical protein